MVGWLIQFFVTKILYTPLFPPSPYLPLHQTIVIGRTTLPATSEYTGVLLLDYVPNITLSRGTLGELFLGRSIPGMVRVFHHPSALPDDLPGWLRGQVDQRLYYDGLDPRVYPLLHAYGMEGVVHNQSMRYHLYTNNCWDFVRRCEEHSHTIMGKMVAFSDTDVMSVSSESRE
jgi:hypothetical protein